MTNKGKKKFVTNKLFLGHCIFVTNLCKSCEDCCNLDIFRDNINHYEMSYACNNQYYFRKNNRFRQFLLMFRIIFIVVKACNLSPDKPY
jgi:hypothetical protein